MDFDMEMDRMPAMAANSFFNRGFGDNFFQRPRARPQSARLFDGMFRQQSSDEGDIFEQFANMMRSRQAQQQPQTTGCSEEFIKNLPEKDKNSECSDCYICLEKCKEGPESVQLPCKHSFDRSCIEHWLKDHDSCPVCRMKLD